MLVAITHWHGCFFLEPLPQRSGIGQLSYGKRVPRGRPFSHIQLSFTFRVRFHWPQQYPFEFQDLDFGCGVSSWTPFSSDAVFSGSGISATGTTPTGSRINRWPVRRPVVLTPAVGTFYEVPTLRYVIPRYFTSIHFTLLHVTSRYFTLLYFYFHLFFFCHFFQKKNIFYFF